MDQFTHEIFCTKFSKFADYVPPPKGTSEREMEGVEIERHLLHLQACCKRLPKAFVMDAIFFSIRYFVNIRQKEKKFITRRKRKYGTPSSEYIRTKPFMIAYSITLLLREPRTPNFYRDLRVYVGCMFLAMKKRKLFDWP